MLTPPPIQLASLGMADSIILMILALVVFGPRRLPQIGRQIGRLMFEFRKASNDFKFQMEEELRAAEEAERRQREEAERKRIAAITAEAQASVSAPAQTVEAAADIGAIEPAASSGYPEAYPVERAAADVATSADMATTADVAPTIQPPRTGEQVSAAAPFSPTALDQTLTEVNPDADTSANAEGLAAGREAVSGHCPPEGESSGIAENDPGIDSAAEITPGHAVDENLSPGAPSHHAGNENLSQGTPSHHHPGDQDLSPGTPSHQASNENLSSGTQKEPVSQHG